MNRLQIIGIGGCRQSMMNLEVTFKMICPDLLMGLANLIRSLCNSDARLNNSQSVHCILGTDIDRLSMIKYNFTHVLIPDCDQIVIFKRFLFVNLMEFDYYALSHKHFSIRADKMKRSIDSE